MNISPELLEKLACPCEQHGELEVNGGSFVSACCGASFAIKFGIPVLLPKGE